MKILFYTIAFLLSAQCAFAQQIVEFKLVTDKDSVAAGDTLTVQIKVKNYIRISTWQFAVNWNKTEYGFINSQNSALLPYPQNYAYNADTSKAVVRMLWYSSLYGQTLADTAICRIKLKALKKSTVSNICFAPDLLVTEVSQSNAQNQPILCEAAFKGLNCGFGFTQTVDGFKTIKPTGTVDTQDIATLDAEISPNPFQTTFTIALKNQRANDMELSLYDQLGRKVLAQKEENTSLITINSAHLPAGLYHFVIKTDKGMSFGKVVKE